MKKLLFALALIVPVAAFGQSLPSPTFNKLKLENGNAVAIPHVKTTSDLKTLVPGTSGDTVYRDGFSIAGDGGGVTYKWSGSACSIGSGAGDDGSQVKPNTGTGCWTAVFPAERDIRVFGAVDDCSTDNTAAFNKAVASLPNTGGTIVFPTQSTGCYAFASAISIGDGTSTSISSKQNVFIKGTAPLGGSASSVIASPATPASPIKLKYTGSSQVSVFLTVNGPMIWGMDGIALDCGSSFKCDTGLKTNHMFQSVVKNVTVVNWKTTGIREDAYPVLPPGVYIGSSSNNWKNIFVSSTGTGVANTAWDIGVTSCTLASCFDVSASSYEDITAQSTDMSGSTSILLRGTDNLVFKNVFTYQISSGHIGFNGWGVYVSPPAGNRALPSEITFIGSPLVGGVSGDANWACDALGSRGITFLALNDGDMANPATGGKPLPTTWSGNECINGVSASGSALDAYQARMIRGGVQYYGVSTVLRDMVGRTTSNSTALTTITSGNLAAKMMRAFYNPTGIANQYVNDRKLRVHVAGVLQNNTGSAQTIRYQLLIGGTSICDTGNMSVPSSAFYAGWTLDMTMSVKNGGVTSNYLDGSGNGVSTGGSLATQFGDCRFELGGTASATSGAMIPGVTTLKAVYDNLALDMASAQTFETKVTLGTASTSLLFTQSQLAVELQ